jgi:poly(3-hydroxybutyrate) depolymerase
MEQNGNPVPDDIAFLKSLVAHLVERSITDPGRVYLAGFSNGGFMALRAVCEGMDLFAAVATIEANMPDPIGSHCRPAKSIALIALSGTADRAVPYGGGPNRNGEIWSTERGIEFFRRLDRCSDPPVESQLPAPEPQATGVTVMSWTQCMRPVALYRVEGGVHRIPEPGFTAEALWSFFRDQPPAPSGARTDAGEASFAATGPSIATGAPFDADAKTDATSPKPNSRFGEEVTFQSNGYTLHGCITRPAGEGPFPAVIYNHGSEKNTTRCGPPALVRAYVDRGYLFFAFDRHGHGLSPGPYILDEQKALRAEIGNPGARAQRSVSLHEEANRDVVGAVTWLMRRPEVDRSRVAMTGVSYGGIQTLLTAEKGLGIRAFVPFAPGAQSWGNEALRRRLERAVRDAKAPIFLAQAENDYSLGPSEVLGPIIRAKGAPNDAKVYPAFGTTHQQGHGGFAVRGGVPIWSTDVFAFLDSATRNGTAASANQEH